MSWSPVTNLKGPTGDPGNVLAIPSGTYRGSWCDPGTAKAGGDAGMAVTGPTVVTDITTPIGTPVGCSLSAGTVTVTQPGIWSFQGTTQYAGGNSAIRAIYFVQSASSTASPKYGLFGTPSADSMATDATFSLAAGQQVSLCTDLWSGSNLFTWLNQGCTIIATWLGNPQVAATTTIPPIAVQLGDSSSAIVTNAAQGNLFRLSMSGNRTLAAPTNPVDGQRIVWEVTAVSATRTLSLSTGTGGFAFGSDIPALTATATNKTDFIGAIYNASAHKWRVVAYTKGF